MVIKAKEASKVTNMRIWKIHLLKRSAHMSTLRTNMRRKIHIHMYCRVLSVATIIKRV
jgi:hypothetical protein